MKEVLYLSFDSLREGVGASQVLAYMRKVAPQRNARILSFEKTMPTPSEINDMQIQGLLWEPLPFGRYGIFGGVGRVFRMWKKTDRTKIVHARSTLPAFAALLKFPKMLIWDCRALQADQRRALSKKKRKNLRFLVLRTIEYVLAKRATKIIVITQAVKPVFVSRFSITPNKIHLISTCVDVNRFQEKPFRITGEIKILLAGTFSAAYDVKLINDIIKELKNYKKVVVTVATSQGSTDLWKELNYDKVISVTHENMPKLIQDNDLGVSIWKNDLGICLKSVASTKTAEFLACGRPILINSLQGDFGQLVKDAQAGVVTSNSTRFEIESYVKEIIVLLADKGTTARCRNLAVKKFSLDNGIKELLSIYTDKDY